MQDIEPFYGWLNLYETGRDEFSPFLGVEYSEFFYDNRVYENCAHPLWDSIGSESLLVKVLFADYDRGYAIIELFGVWNDLLENDYRLLLENCLHWMHSNGVNKFIFLCDNVLNIYLDGDDYYEAMQEDLEDGWIALVRVREHVMEELQKYNIDHFFFWSERLNEIQWRKMRPWQLYGLVEESMMKLLI